MIYDRGNETRIESDAFQYGLAAIICQKIDDDWRPVSYASRSLTETEQRYFIIEKEMLAISFACSRFRDYIVGLPRFEIVTDHSPLVSLLSVKKIDELSPRLQRMRLQIAGLPYVVRYQKGSSNISADCLSRAPVEGTEGADEDMKKVEIPPQAYFKVFEIA